MLLHLLANTFHANGLPDLHKVAPSGADLFDVPAELVVHLCKDVCYPAFTCDHTSGSVQGLERHQRNMRTFQVYHPCEAGLGGGSRLQYTHQNLKMTPHRVSLLTLRAFITPCKRPV